MGGRQSTNEGDADRSGVMKLSARGTGEGESWRKAITCRPKGDSDRCSDV